MKVDCEQAGCAEADHSYEASDSHTRRSARKLPFSQKNFQETADNKGNNVYPKRFHNYLDQPTDIIITVWGEDGTYKTRYVKKAKTIPRTTEDGLGMRWVRRTVRKETNGEVLLDEFASLSEIDATRKVGIFSDRTNKVLMLKNAKGKYELPSCSSVEQDRFVKDAERKTGLSLQKDRFVPLFTLSTGTYQAYTQPIDLTESIFNSKRQEPEHSHFPDFRFVNPTAPSLEYWHDIEHNSLNFLDVLGDKIKDVVDQKSMCACAECLVGETPPWITPPEQLPDYFGGEEHDEEWQQLYNRKAFISEELEDSFERIDLRAPNFTFSAGNWTCSNVSPLLYDIPLIAMTDEELRAEVLTRAGLTKLHKQFFHLQEHELFRRIQHFVPEDQHAAIKKLCRLVVWGCPECRKHRKPGNKPKLGGLWAHNVGDIVACDTFIIKHPPDDYSKKPEFKGGRKYAVLHMIDLFSGYSLGYVCPGETSKPEDTVACLRKWTERFGILPRTFFSDQGGEFTGHEFTSYLLSKGVKQMFSPPHSPYTNGVNERHNGILKVWMKRIMADCRNLSFLCILREALRVKNATTRRHGYAATFLAFGYKPEDELQVSINDLVEPHWNPDAAMRERLQARAAAHRAVAEYLSSEKLKNALEKYLQNTDKTPMRKGLRVDYHIVPDGLKNKAYWEPGAKVLETDPGETGDQSGKTVLILRQNNQPARVARHKLRPSNEANCIQLKAIDLQKSDWQIAKAIQERDAEEKEKKEYVYEKVVPDSENPNKEQNVIDFLSTMLDQQTNFMQVMTNFAAFGSGKRHPTKKETAALEEVVANTRPKTPLFVDTRKKKKIEEDSDEKHESTEPTQTSVYPQAAEHKPAVTPKAKVKAKAKVQIQSKPLNVPQDEDRPPEVEPRRSPTRRAASQEREQSRERSPSRAPMTPSKPSRGKEPASQFKRRAAEIIQDRLATSQARTKEKIGTDEQPKEERRSSRLNPGKQTSPLKELTDHRLSQVKTKLQDIGTGRSLKFRTKSVVDSLQRAEEKKTRERNQEKSLREKRRSSEQKDEVIESNEKNAQKYGMTPPKKGVKELVQDIHGQYDQEWNTGSRAPRPPQGNHRGPGDGTDTLPHIVPGEVRDYIQEEEAGQRAAENFDIGSDDNEPESKIEENAELADEIDSDAETVEVDEWIPPNFYAYMNDEGDTDFTYWYEHPELEDILVPDAVIARAQAKFPLMHAMLGNQAKVKLKPGREIPRTEALADDEFWQAMIREIDQLLANGAKFAKPPTEGAFVYSSRWVYTYKDDGTRKARIVVRGFEEAWNPASEDHATDSPTLNRDSIRIISLTAASKKWNLQSWDIKTAFQQAQTQDDPDETETEKQGLWIKLPKWFPGCYPTDGENICLKVPSGKTLYGMASAPRRWFFTLRRAMTQCGFKSSKSDDCMFFLHDKNDEVIGIAGWHVDDGLLTGTKEFWDAMEKVAVLLKFGKRIHTDFRFCGMRIRQDKDFSVHLDQSDMIDLLTPIDLGTKKRNKLDSATPAEITEMRGRIGSMLYLVGNTRPIESYAVSHLSGFTNEAKVVHLENINLLVQQFKNNRELGITYQGGCSVDYMYTFHDSSFKSERESGSQMGIMSFVGPPISPNGNINGASLLRWASKRARRVCHSTLAAETLAATGGLDSQAGLAFRLNEIGFFPKSVLLTDCRSLFDHIYAMTGKTAEMLLPDIHELREASMPWRHALSEDYTDNFIELWWCSTNVQLADNLTKIDTPSNQDLIQVLKNNIIKLGTEGLTKTEDGKKTQGYLRPRKTQQAHSFGTFQYHFYDVLVAVEESQKAQCPCGYIKDIHAYGHVCESEVDPLPELRVLYTELIDYITGTD